MTESTNTGTVYLVGAGPGDPDLLTVKAHRLLRSCDALVYDSLVPREVLDLVPECCERHFVGKRRGHHSVPQPSTNSVLVMLAKRYQTVVRLKGGTPFCSVVVVKKPPIWYPTGFKLRLFLVSRRVLRLRPMPEFL